MQAILDYSRKLASLAGEEGIVPGVAAPSLAGGDWVEGSKKRDVRDVYRFYCDERASEAVGHRVTPRSVCVCVGGGASAGRVPLLLRRAHQRGGGSPGHALVTQQLGLPLHPRAEPRSCSIAAAPPARLHSRHPQAPLLRPLHTQRAFTPALDADLKELASILCLAPKDAADLRAEVAAGLYRRLLKDEVTSGRIDKAPSPAQVRVYKSRRARVRV